MFFILQIIFGVSSFAVQHAAVLLVVCGCLWVFILSCPKKYWHNRTVIHPKDGHTYCTATPSC